MKRPDPNSKTTARRRNRGFQSLVQSSRKHRRAERRSLQKRTQYGVLLQPGQKMDKGPGTFKHTAGGSIKYH